MHDFDAQRSDTEDTFSRISALYPIAGPVALDLQFEPSAGANWGFAIDALQKLGFSVSAYEDILTLEATITVDDPSVDSIWQAERCATEAVLPHGFKPDGWGFVLSAQRGFLGGLAARLSGIFGRA